MIGIGDILKIREYSVIVVEPDLEVINSCDKCPLCRSPFELCGDFTEECMNLVDYLTFNKV